MENGKSVFLSQPEFLMTNDAGIDVFEKNIRTKVTMSKRRLHSAIDFTKEEMELEDIANIISQMRFDPVLADKEVETIRKKETSTLSEGLRANPSKCAASQILTVV